MFPVLLSALGLLPLLAHAAASTWSKDTLHVKNLTWNTVYELCSASLLTTVSRSNTDKSPHTHSRRWTQYDSVFFSISILCISGSSSCIMTHDLILSFSFFYHPWILPSDFFYPVFDHQSQSALLDEPHILWGCRWRWAAARDPMTPGSQRRSVPWHWCSMVPLWALWEVSERSGGQSMQHSSWYTPKYMKIFSHVHVQWIHKWADCGQTKSWLSSSGDSKYCSWKQRSLLHFWLCCYIFSFGLIKCFWHKKENFWVVCRIFVSKCFPK